MLNEAAGCTDFGGWPAAWANRLQVQHDHLHAMCRELLRVAIEANICSDHLSDTLLLALSQLASSGDTHPACERLCVACFLTAQFAPWGSFQPGEHRRNLPKPALCLLLDAVHGALEMAAVKPVSDVQVKFQYLPKGVLSEADMRAWEECYGEVTEVRIQCQGQTFKNGHRQNYHYEEGFVRMTREKAAKSFANDLANTRLRNAKGGFDAQEVGACLHVEPVPGATPRPRAPTPTPPPPLGPGTSDEDSSDGESRDERWMCRWSGEGKYQPLNPFAWAP